MNRVVDRAQMTTSTVGTGSLTLVAATVGYRSFAAAGLANGDRVSYLILDASNAWEIGDGVVGGGGTTLTRVVRSSTNGNAALALTGGAIVGIIQQSNDSIEREVDDWFYH